MTYLDIAFKVNPLITGADAECPWATPADINWPTVDVYTKKTRDPTVNDFLRIGQDC